MLLKLPLLSVLAASVQVAFAADAQNFKLYAYGTGIKPGLRLFYGDGQSFPLWPTA